MRQSLETGIARELKKYGTDILKDENFYNDLSEETTD